MKKNIMKTFKEQKTYQKEDSGLDINKLVQLRHEICHFVPRQTASFTAVIQPQTRKATCVSWAL